MSLYESVKTTCSIECSVCGAEVSNSNQNDYYFAEELEGAGWKQTLDGDALCPTCAEHEKKAENNG